MKFLLLIPFAFSFTVSRAQAPLDDIVHMDKICRTTKRCRPCDSTFRLPSICNSTKKIEIRMTTVDEDQQIAEEIALCSNGEGQWETVRGRYQIYSKGKGEREYRDTCHYTFDRTSGSLDSMFANLKRNDLLTLTNNAATDSLRLEGSTIFHQISIKIGSKFRAFRFGDSDALSQLYPDQPYFKKCSILFHLMSEL